MSTEIYDDNEWETAYDSDSNREYFVNHRLRTTQWLNPRMTKPASFADCSGDQLPYGWERLEDPKIGIYYANHIERKNQLEDPRIEWQNKRRKMFDQYLQRHQATHNIHNQVYQTICVDHHKSCLEVSPPRHILAQKFSSRPNLTSSIFSDRVGQENNTNYSYRPFTVKKEQFLCHQANEQSSRHESSDESNLHSEMHTTMTISDTSAPSDCRDIPQIHYESSNNCTQTNSRATNDHQDNLKASMTAENTESNLEKTETISNESIKRPRSLNTPESNVPQREDIDHNDILKTMDRLYKKGSSDGVEV